MFPNSVWERNFSKLCFAEWTEGFSLRVLWLAFETVPHPEAVVYGADEADARLAAVLLKAPLRERVWYADQLRGYLREQESLSPFDRPGVACREAPGLFRVISWRFAKWLANVLPADAGMIEGTLGRIEGWLHSRQ